jgi:hypothetical protein
LAQDPFIKISLHDGDFDNGGNHVGESVKTSTKNNAGGNATWNETFVLNKPGVDQSFVEFKDFEKIIYLHVRREHGRFEVPVA